MFRWFTRLLRRAVRVTRTAWSVARALAAYIEPPRAFVPTAWSSLR